MTSSALVNAKSQSMLKARVPALVFQTELAPESGKVEVVDLVEDVGGGEVG